MFRGWQEASVAARESRREGRHHTGVAEVAGAQGSDTHLRDVTLPLRETGSTGELSEGRIWTDLGLYRNSLGTTGAIAGGRTRHKGELRMTLRFLL